MSLIEIILYLIIGIEFLYPFTIRYLGFPQLPSFTIETLILLLFIIIYINSFISRKKLNFFHNTLNTYRYLIFAFILIIILSAVLNANNFLLVLKSMFQYSLLFIIFFLAILELDLNERSQENLVKFIYLMIFIQIPVTIYQYLFLGYPTADYNSGTIASANAGGTGIIGILMMFSQAFLVSAILIKGFNIKRLFFIIITFIPIIAGGARLGLVLSPIVILMTITSFYLVTQNTHKKEFPRIFITLFSFTAFMLFLIIAVIPNTKFANYLDLSTLTNKEKFSAYNSEAKDSRTLPYSILFKYTLTDDINYLVGMGNAEITQSQMANANTAKLMNVQAYPDAVLILASNGIVGLLLVLLIFFACIGVLKRYYKIEMSEFMKIVSLSFIPITLIIILSLFYTNAFATQLFLSYWVIMAVLLQRYSTLQKARDFLLSIK